MRWALGYDSTSPATTTSVRDYVRIQGYGLKDPTNVTVPTTWPDGHNKQGHRVKVVVPYTYAPPAMNERLPPSAMRLYNRDSRSHGAIV